MQKLLSGKLKTTVKCKIPRIGLGRSFDDNIYAADNLHIINTVIFIHSFHSYKVMVILYMQDIIHICSMRKGYLSYEIMELLRAPLGHKWYLFILL
jgi:hypothetical protein